MQTRRRSFGALTYQVAVFQFEELLGALVFMNRIVISNDAFSVDTGLVGDVLG